MSDKTFWLDVVTPEGAAYSKDVTQVIVPAHEGYLGVKANHAPLLCLLQPGKLRADLPGGDQEFLAISGGYLEVSENRVTVLADAAERPGDIDLARAKAAADRARERLSDARNRELEFAIAETELQRAVNRIRIAEEGH